MTVDTKAARAMRANGTPGEWETGVGWEQFEPGVYMFASTPGRMSEVFYCPGEDDDETCGKNLSSANAALSAYAVNNIVPFVDEIDRLRALLEDVRDDEMFARTNRVGELRHETLDRVVREVGTISAHELERRIRKSNRLLRSEVAALRAQLAEALAKPEKG